MSDKSYYSILGVDEKASQEEIKKAYRKMSLLHHPDRNANSEDSVKKFQTISEAFENI